MRTMDRVVFATAATAIHQVGHIEQPIYTHIRPMGRVVFVTEPSARYANSLQQQPHGKHHYSNGNREIDTTEELPNSQTS